jgi:6-phosphogluconolactonase
MIAARRDFADRRALASALAHDISQRLDTALSDRGAALIAVSGGTTPKLLFEHLSREPIGWAHVTVTLVDERCVSDDNERSNARLVKTHLLVNSATAARFVPLFGNRDAAAKLGPFDAVVLGMGTDGHTASYFPGGDNLAGALDLKSTARVVSIKAPGAGEQRLTFSLGALLDSGFIALHIEGEEKVQVLAEALKPGPVEAMPIRAFLGTPEPITVYWSP